jgi:hypothetical protein
MKINYLIILTIGVIIISSCTTKPATPKNLELSSWKESPIKESIIKFIERDTKDIPIEDRIAVFDMDGTIACEAPLWFKMYCAVAKLNDDLSQDSTLLRYKWYAYAAKLHQNPADTSVQNNWVTKNANYIDSMIWKAFEGDSHEYYVSYCSKYLNAALNTEKNVVLAEMFYAPMLELISYLQCNSYQVYIVSGSVQGVIWSIVPQKTSLTRPQLLGTRQILKPDYSSPKTQFIIQSGLFTPKNNNDGKSENIYARLGKEPIFAFGNTTGDFSMLHYAINSKHKGVGFMLNHDDPREYIYPPYHGTTEPNWLSTLTSFGGVVVSMEENFNSVW